MKINPFYLPIIRLSSLVVGVADCGYSLVLSCAFFCCVMPDSIDALPDLISLASMGGVGILAAQLCIVIFLITGARWAYNVHWIGIFLGIIISICAFRLDIELKSIDANKSSMSYTETDDEKKRILAEIDRLQKQRNMDAGGYMDANERTKARKVMAWYDEKIATQEQKLKSLRTEQKEDSRDISTDKPSPELIFGLIARDTVKLFRLDEGAEADIKMTLMYFTVVVRAGLIDLTGPRLIAFGFGLGQTGIVEVSKAAAVKVIISRLVSTFQCWWCALVSVLMSILSRFKRQESMPVEIDKKMSKTSTTETNQTDTQESTNHETGSTLPKVDIDPPANVDVDPDELKIVELIRSMSNPTKSRVAVEAFGPGRSNTRYTGKVVAVAEKNGIAHLLGNNGNGSNGNDNFRHVTRPDPAV